MKFNWGTGIVIGATAFTTFISVMVYKCVQQSFDLVSPDYYAQELKYENQITRINNTADLKDRFAVSYDQQNKMINLSLSSFVKESISGGTVVLYKPDNASADKIVDLILSDGGTQEIGASGLPPGAWDVKVSWSSGGNEYYQKERIYIYK